MSRPLYYKKYIVNIAGRFENLNAKKANLNKYICKRLETIMGSHMFLNCPAANYDDYVVNLRRLRSFFRKRPTLDINQRQKNNIAYNTRLNDAVTLR